MTYLEELKIFLASPGDVARERRYVDEVVDEVNRTVAVKRGFSLRVVRSERDAFPGYGKDGQAILNDQIGNMQEYELLVGIMWNRIGTPTPRADSGTIEEFERAVKSWLRKRKPQIWFYFRQHAAEFNTIEALEQRKGVLAFREKFQKEKRGLFRDYKTSADFCKQFRMQLNLWLDWRETTGASSSKSKPVSSPKTQKREAGAAQHSSTLKRSTSPSTNTKLSEAEDSKKAASATVNKPPARKTTTAAKPSSTTSQKSSTSKSSNSRSSEAVKSPRSGVMLDGKIFQAKSVNTQSDKSIILQIQPKDMEQIAELKTFHPGEFHNRRLISYADLHEAGNLQVASVTTESASGKSIFNITLSSNRQQLNSGWGEVNYQGYNAEKVAELRARQILLGEPLPTEIERFSPTQITVPNSPPMTIGKGIFPELFAKLETQPSVFLLKAWLWAAYCLKMSQVVEDVLELELGPIKNKVMPVKFQGRRRQFYSNPDPALIKVVGSCTLSE